MLALVGAVYLVSQFINQSGRSKHNVKPAEYAFKVADELPLYGAEPVGFPHPDYYAAKAEATARLLDYISTNLTYPEAARKVRFEGTAVLVFHVETDGTMSALRVVRDPGHRLGQAALQVVSKLAAHGERWRPAYRDGAPVRFHFNLPVYFRLPENG